MVGSSCQFWPVTIVLVVLFGASGNLEGLNRNVADSIYSENLVFCVFGSYFQDPFPKVTATMVTLGSSLGCQAWEIGLLSFSHHVLFPVIAIHPAKGGRWEINAVVPVFQQVSLLLFIHLLFCYC